jgi:hypothetical protein
MSKAKKTGKINSDYVLVKYTGDWADEMTVQGFGAFKKQFWQDYVKKAKKILKGKDVVFVFGTNEEIRMDVISFFKEMEVTNISKAEYDVLFKHFEYDIEEWNEKKENWETTYTIVKFGHFPFFVDSELKEMRGEDEEEDLEGE